MHDNIYRSRTFLQKFRVAPNYSQAIIIPLKQGRGGGGREGLSAHADDAEVKGGAENVDDYVS